MTSGDPPDCDDENSGGHDAVWEECEADPASFAKAVLELKAAVKTLLRCVAADTALQLEQLKDRMSEADDRSLAGWSLRISKQGLEIQDRDLSSWMQDYDWVEPGCIRNFGPTDTKSWLYHHLNVHRNTVSRLVAYQIFQDSSAFSQDDVSSLVVSLQSGQKPPASN